MADLAQGQSWSLLKVVPNVELSDVYDVAVFEKINCSAPEEHLKFVVCIRYPWFLFGYLPSSFHVV
jgi:hypothetical protein